MSLCGVQSSRRPSRRRTALRSLRARPRRGPRAMRRAPRQPELAGAQVPWSEPSDGSYSGDMALDDELINRITWKIPNALALVGSAHDGERNAMTTSWITQLSMEPVLIGVGVDNSAVTHRLISARAQFTSTCGTARTRARSSSSRNQQSTTARRSTDGRFAQRPRAPRCSTTRSPGWTARYVTRSTSAPTRCSSARLVDGGIHDDEARSAAMSDTRMKYGGVKRH